MNSKYRIIGGGILSVVIACFGGYGYINGYINGLDHYGLFLFASILVALVTLGSDDD